MLALSEKYALTINPKVEDDWSLLAVGSFVKKSKKPVSKKKKNSRAHYQQIWEILESRIDGQGERFTHSKHCRTVIITWTYSNLHAPTSAFSVLCDSAFWAIMV